MFLYTFIVITTPLPGTTSILHEFYTIQDIYKHYIIIYKMMIKFCKMEQKNQFFFTFQLPTQEKMPQTRHNQLYLFNNP